MCLDEKETGARIKLIRQALKLKQSDFAKKTGMSGPSLSELENGKYKPNVGFLARLHTLYRVNIYYVLFGTGDMFIDPGLPNLLDTEQDYWVNSTEVREFFYYFGKSPMFQYEIMYETRKKLLSGRSIFDEDIRQEKEKKSGQEGE
ncbi:MAG: helix-turn-helix transcriptional regulator [bacterium]|nr:helix-turn-helix transcriptional regulator [bacterium]